MSLYKNYIEEKSDKLILETDKGFIVYQYPDPTTVYIEDIYILPEFRKEYIGTAMANQIVQEAKQKGCTKLIGSVIPTTKDCTSSLAAFLAYGMKLDSCTNNFILLSRSI